MTHMNAVNAVTTDMFLRGHKEEAWAKLHWERWVMGGNKWASTLRKLIEGLALYADGYSEVYRTPIGEDAVMGKAWRDAVLAIRGMLDGECGGLDCGTLDTMLLDMIRREGMEVPK